MNTIFKLYASGSNSIDVLNQFPNEILEEVKSSDFGLPIAIPVGKDYGELVDNSSQVSFNPSYDDRVFVGISIPKDETDMWTTYCHIVADNMLLTRSAALKMICDEDNILIFIYQDDMQDEYFINNAMSLIESMHSEEYELGICELLHDYINQIYQSRLMDETTDFRHKCVKWTILIPDLEELENDNYLYAAINGYRTMNMYKFCQYSDIRLSSFDIHELSHEDINENMKLEEDVMNTGFIWFGTNTENNPFGYTDNENKMIIKCIDKSLKESKSVFPTVVSMIRNSKDKDPDESIKICTIGSTISCVDRSLAERIDPVVDEIYKYINKEDE